MRTLLSILCLVALSQARPENAATPQVPQLDSDNVQAVLKVLPKITSAFSSTDGDASSSLRRISGAIVDVVRESAPEDRRQQVEDAAQFSNAIIDTIAEMVKDLPKVDIPEFKVPEIPEVVIPKIEIPDIPEVVIPEFKIPDFKIPEFQTDDAFKVDVPEIVIPEVVIPKFNIPDVPEFQAPKIDIPDF